MDEAAQAPPVIGSGPEEPPPWPHRRWRTLAAGAFLAYLLFVGLAVAQYAHGTAEALGYVVLGLFGAVYLWYVATVRESDAESTRFWWAIAALALLFVAELPLARATAFVMCGYIAAIAVTRFELRAMPVVIGLALAALLVPALVPSWHDSVGDDLAMATPIAIPVIGLVGLGVMAMTRYNRELAAARAEVARLGAETERIRIARDLHDLLGHSLTTITVKAGLAHRVGRSDVGRALAEVAEIEQLARRSLSDVRAAVAGYRDVTLTGELATGRELLRSAGIAAELPTATDAVPADHQELFGWVVREGVTNVVRHAHAGTCVVRVSPASVEIIDDGVGAADAASVNGGGGSGLAGLRERVDAAGGLVRAGPVAGGGGWRLWVSLDGGSGRP